MSAAQAWIDARADAMAALVERLVAIDTENPPGRGLRACAAALQEAMERLELQPEVIELPPSGDLEDPRIVRGSAGTGLADRVLPRPLRRRAGAVARAVRARNGRTGGFTAAAPPT